MILLHIIITIIIIINKMNSKLKKVAVILSGCGRADGSEIQEAVSILINLSKNKL